MKKVLYSNITKISAVILCILFSGISTSVLLSALAKNYGNDDVYYMFEQSYEDSFHAKNEVFSMYSIISSTMTDQKQLEQELNYLNSKKTVEYYVLYNGKEYANTADKSYEKFLSSPVSMGIKFDHSSKYTGHYETFSNPPQGSYIYPDVNKSDLTEYSDSSAEETSESISPDNTKKDESYILCVRMPKTVIAENSKLWEEKSYAMQNAASYVIIFFILSVLLFVYLLFVSGKKANDDKIYTMTIDRCFIEINAAVLIGLSVLYIALVFLIIDQTILHGTASSIIYTITGILTAAESGILLCCILSMVRNIKNKTFIKRSLICICVKFVWRTIKRIIKSVLNFFRKIKNTIVSAYVNGFKGYYPSLLILGYSFVFMILMCLGGFGILLDIAIAVFAAYILLKRFNGFTKLKDGIEKIKNGDLSYKIDDTEKGIISKIASDVNSIGDGLKNALAKEVKAERMKSELITNVSHDLKTPLTSIINYTDLLSKEELLPPEANDYVKIIRQKSARLKQLTNDLFAVSKAQSGNEEFNNEKIDLCLLLNQALAEHDERIKASDLTFISQIPNHEINVNADGKKLSRVFENLIINCLKYSMANTRVYIMLTEKDKNVSVEFKNISNYQMEFDDSEITERFVRGDKTRSTEGSGLGLAIVNSYVNGCNGKFYVKTDGDLFKAVIEFKTV